MRIILTFLLFAGLAYYFNIDVRVLVDKSGVPQWLSEHGLGTSAEVASTTPTTGTSSDSTMVNSTTPE